ncbi:MAG: ABC transporter ATP-binding protein [Rhodoferax sp.]|uniref:ABC transporter ATP-binding protein n=1 Tax=Rhodoferax sp. TaxID=50421 RepID=UPI00262B5529|nr:ABC transporter ATP-binding protein [Rhodoferax sp.]MDD5336060.1 ABC transporter ATP-binding protein [Rhodoferax sp.]
MSLQLHDLSLTLDGVTHLGGVSASFQRGQLTTVIGRTLAGKTTLMRAICGLQPLDRGALQLDGQNFSALAPWQRDIAMVYQQFINYPHLNVAENVAFPLRRKKLDQAVIAQRVRGVLDKVGLTGFETRRPSQLSGGQQQRVALARSLARESGILLLDEPLVNLDYKLREQMRGEFRSLLSDQDQTIVIYNTTDPVEAMLLGDTVVVMHQGRILQIGTPAQVFDSPASLQVAAVVNDPPMNFIRGRKKEGSIELAGGTGIDLPWHLESLAQGDYWFGIRANELRLGETSLTGQVTFSEVSGSETFLYVDSAVGPLTLQVQGVHIHDLDARLGIGIPAERLFAFEASGQQALLAAPATGERS